MHRAVLLLLLLPGAQEPPSKGEGESFSTDSFKFIFRDPRTGEVEAIISGRGSGIRAKEKGGYLEQGQLWAYSRPSEEPTSRDSGVHQLFLVFGRCDAEQLSQESHNEGVFRFSRGVRAFLDGDLRLSTVDASLDRQSQVLYCPQATRLVHYTWITPLDLASLLVYLGPPEMEWLQFLGGPTPDVELTGEDFQFDIRDGVYTVGRKGRLVVSGEPGAVLRGRPAQPTRARDNRMELHSQGPLRLHPQMAESPGAWTVVHVTAERDVVIEHRSAGAMTRTRSDAASIYVGIPPGAKGAGDPQPLSIVLKGGVKVEDGRGFSVTADKLEWNHQEDLYRLTGAPLVVVEQGVQRLRAREVTLDRWNGIIDFRGDIAATLQPGRESKGSAPASARTMNLTSTELRIRTDPAGRPLSVRARDNVRLTGHLGAAGPDAIEAEAEEFEWDLVTEEGLLRGAPFARVRRGPNLVVAPLVSFQGESFMVIKGPKLVKFQSVRKSAGEARASFFEAALGLRGLQGIPGRAATILERTATCDGDIVFDQKAGLVKLVDRCSVSEKDSLLTADLLYVEFTKEKVGENQEIDRVLGYGNVVAWQGQESRGGPIQIRGEYLEYHPGSSDLTVVGHPEAKAIVGSREAWARRIRLNQDTERYELDDLRTGLPNPENRP